MPAVFTEMELKEEQERETKTSDGGRSTFRRCGLWFVRGSRRQWLHQHRPRGPHGSRVRFTDVSQSSSLTFPSRTCRNSQRAANRKSSDLDHPARSARRSSSSTSFMGAESEIVFHLGTPRV